ncbi:MAG: hypothetical protein L6276_05170 [Acetobacterium sp.]|nr:hypothetical protein [Acetobacterium woodii]MCG2729659.1 hypothetical protein [Acetobacterium sp.]
MVRLRFATYYENHPETYDISKILETSNDQIKSTIDVKKEALENEQKKTARIAQVSEKNRQADERAYLKQSVEMKIELALMYLNRSTAHLQYL